MSKPRHQPRIRPNPADSPEQAEPTSARPLARDIRRGVRIGLMYGFGFTVIAVIIFGVVGNRGFERAGTSFGAVATLYLCGGAAAGLVAGTFARAASRYVPVAYGVGIIAAAPMAFASTVLVSHRMAGWHTAEWGTAITASIIYGILGVRLLRR